MFNSGKYIAQEGRVKPSLPQTRREGTTYAQEIQALATISGIPNELYRVQGSGFGAWGLGLGPQ